MDDLKTLFRRILDSLAFGILQFVPARPDHWAFVLHRGHVWSGNLRVLAEHAARHHGIKIVVLCRDGGRSPAAMPAATWTDSPAALAYIRCGVIFSTHEPEPNATSPLRIARITSRQRYLLWHGVGTKVHSRDAHPWMRSVNCFFDGTFAASEHDKDRLARAFGFEPARIAVTGYPRIEVLKCAETQLTDDLADQHSALRAALAGKTLVLAAPTFDTVRDQPDAVIDFVIRLRAMLEARFEVGLRLHPNNLLRNTTLKVPKGILDLGPRQWPSTEMVLRNSGVLVTDFSSIWADFALLRRPIIGLKPFTAPYVENGRVSPALWDEFPGTWCETVEQTVKCIMDTRHEPADSAKLDAAVRRIHGEQPDSSEQICRWVFARQPGADRPPSA